MPPQDAHEDFHPFSDRPNFELAELLFEKMSASKGEITHILHILHAQDILHGGDPDRDLFFTSHADFLSTIDSIENGETEWETFSISFAGPLPANAPAWKKQKYIIHTRNSLRAVESMASSPDFKHSWHTRPYRQYDEHGVRQFSDLMSAHWAWKQAVRRVQSAYGSRC